jgi:hypothetical protein
MLIWMSINAVHDHNYWSQLNEPPNLDEILSPIIESQVPSSHCNVPITMMNTPSSSSSTMELNDLHSMIKASPLPSNTASNSIPHTNKVLNNWDDLCSIDDDNILEFLNSWQETVAPNSEIFTDIKQKTASLSSPSPIFAQNQLINNFVPSHSVELEEGKMFSNQKLIYSPEVPASTTLAKNSKTSIVDFSSNEQNLCFLPSYHGLEGDSTTFKDNLRNSTSKRRKMQTPGQPDDIQEFQRKSFKNKSPSEIVEYTPMISSTPESSCKVPLTTLEFDPTVFGIEGASPLDEYRIKEIISIITEKGLDNRLLMIDILRPEYASKIFRRSACRGPGQKNQDNYSQVKNLSGGARKRRREDLKKRAIQEFFSKIQYWTKFYKEKSGIEFNDLNLNYLGVINTQELELHYLLYLFYIDMITSIIVLQRDPTNSHLFRMNNKDIVHKAAMDYNSSIQEIISTRTERLFLRKESLLDLVWMEVLDWFHLQRESSSFHILLENILTKEAASLFFHSVFCYSITNLSKRIYEEYKEL